MTKPPLGAEMDAAPQAATQSPFQNDTHQFNIRHYGAKGDGVTLDTAAIQAAVQACAEAAGGAVVAPAGTYLTGAIELRSHVTLHLLAGATLLGSQDPAHYPQIEARWEGRTQPSHAPLIGGSGLTNVAITGAGTVDGQGAYWWRRHRARALDLPRPRLISFAECDGLRIEGVTLINSPSWTVNPVRCNNVLVHGLTIRNPGDSPNTDGINPDSCDNVRIADCYISVGDDCIAIKAGIESEQEALRAPCQNIAITNCIMADGHGGVVIGSEMNGDVRNVVIANCIFRGTDRGIRMKSRRGRGGVIEDVRVSNIVMTDVLCPFTMNLYYAPGVWGDAWVADKRAQAVGDWTPRIRRVHISNVSVRGALLAAAFFYGLPEMPIEEISLSDVQIVMAENATPAPAEMADGIDAMARHGLFVCHAQGVRLHNVQIARQAGSGFDLAQVSDLVIHSCSSATADGEHAAIRLQDVREAFVQGARAHAATKTLVAVSGAESSNIVLNGNQVLQGQHALALAPEVSAATVRAN